MSIVKWDPFGNLTTLQDRINRLFEDAFPQAVGKSPFGTGEWHPAVDIFEGENTVVIHAELAGMRKEDISIEVKDNVLTLKGKRSFNREVQEERFYRKERRFGSFQRTFHLPVSVAPDSIRARYKDGVLEIEIPKPREEEPKKVTVAID